MNKTQRILFYAFVLTVGAAWIVFSADSTNASVKTSAPQTGFITPDVTLQAVDGKTYSLSELKGSAILINLWATWCPPCRAEMPTIEKIYREYKNQGLIVLAVNMTYQDDSAAVLPFAQKYNLTFPILLDEKGLIGSAYQLHSLPSSYFINRAGVINEVVIGGPMAEAALRARVEQILK